jgi:hypothetical protein
MTGFEDREKAFENRYAHQEKLSFEVEARCCKLFGLWAAEKLGLEGPDAHTYALEVVESNLEEAGFEDVLRKVRADFEDKSVEVSDHIMRTQLDQCLNEAKKQIMEQKK